MAKNIKPVPLAITIVVAVILQFALIAADCVQNPTKVARNFAEAYYYLDADMQDYLCADLAKKEQVVDSYLYRKNLEASQRGLPVNYLRQKFIKMHLSVAASGPDTVKLHLEGTTRVCINPVFMLVGKLFQIGQDYSVDERIELIKENGQWRVCGNPFGINHPV